jgi:mono/diheme cytochrome c family protein
MRTNTPSIALGIMCSLLCLIFNQTLHATADKWQAPPEASAVPNPEANNTAAPAAGRKAFMRACVNCHGEEGAGQENGAADLRSAEVQSQTDGALFWKISKGSTANGMPTFTSLPETERWDIVTFLRTLKKTGDSGGSGNSGDKKSAH